MDNDPTTCRVRVKWQRSEGSDEYAIRSLKDIKQSPDMTEKNRQQWIKEIVKSFHPGSKGATTTIRPWDILLHQDGSVETLSSEKGNRSSSYPSRFRIPPRTVLGLDEGDKVKRAETFALGSLLYEVVTATVPFEGLGDDEVQDNYSRGVFPDDVFSMAMGPYILGCWSLEFEKEMKKYLPSLGDRFRTYAKAHPFLLASQIVGGVTVGASIVALPILGAAGFAATGPVAGSAVAAWQSSIGVVQAGSLFAWCQSAAMGGTAVNGIIAVGAAGGGVALAATGGAVAGGQVALTPEKIKEMFLAVYRTGNGGVVVNSLAEKSKV